MSSYHIILILGFSVVAVLSKAKAHFFVNVYKEALYSMEIFVIPLEQLFGVTCLIGNALFSYQKLLFSVYVDEGGTLEPTLT